MAKGWPLRACGMEKGWIRMASTMSTGSTFVRPFKNQLSCVEESVLICCRVGSRSIARKSPIVRL